MTNKQALKEAVRRWGQNAGVQFNPKSSLKCTVGVAVMGLIFMVKGQGETWEEAFKNATERWEKP